MLSHRWELDLNGRGRPLPRAEAAMLGMRALNVSIEKDTDSVGLVQHSIEKPRNIEKQNVDLQHHKALTAVSIIKREIETTDGSLSQPHGERYFTRPIAWRVVLCLC